MSRHAAILGLGTRGMAWAATCAASGWQVAGFDPDPAAGADLADDRTCRRAPTISEAVRAADLVIACLPERLELVQMVLQRAQAAGREDAVLCVMSRDCDVEALQACAIRPGRIFRLSETVNGAVSLDVSPRNAPDVCGAAETLLAELMAHRSLMAVNVDEGYTPDAESA